MLCTLCKRDLDPSAFWSIGTRWAAARGGCYTRCIECATQARTRYELLPDDHPLIADGKRRCPQCQEERPLSEFGRTRFSPLGRQYTCTECMNNRRRKNTPRRKSAFTNATEYQRVWKWKLSAAEFDKLFKSQNGQCAICAKSLEYYAKDTCVDHDHKSGKIRGILCGKCNLGIGHLRDSPATILASVNYLLLHLELPTLGERLNGPTSQQRSARTP